MSAAIKTILTRFLIEAARGPRSLCCASYASCAAGAARSPAGLPYLEQAVRAWPTNAVARHGLGSALILLNRTEEALAEWETAERLAPNGPNQYNLSAFIGYALLKLGQPEAALARFDHAISLLPTFVAARNPRALTLELLGDSPTAIAEMRQARALQITQDGKDIFARW